MKSIPVSTLKAGLKFAGDVFLDDGFLLLTPEVIMSEELVQRLKSWGYGEIYQGEGTAAPSEAVDSEEDSAGGSSDENPKELKEVVTFYKGLLEFTQKLFQMFIRRNQISMEPLTEQIKEIIQVVKSHKRYILRFNELDKGDYPYLTFHSANVAILVVALGEAMKVPTHKLIDLGIAGLLHEVGMLKLPEKLQNSKNPLSMDEKKALSAHPIIGFKALKALAFPPNVYVPVLQHHERMDGTGYPQGITSDRIADFSKILAVASAYDAMLSSRPYRDARSGHSSLLDLLKDIGRAHDEGVLRKLVFILGLYPIGSTVEMSNNALAQVIDSNPENPKLPKIRILTTAERKALAEPREVNMMDDSELSIRRVLDKEEIDRLRENKILA